MAEVVRQVSGPASYEDASAQENSNHINVAVRCRPLSASEMASGAVDIVRIMDHKLVLLMDPGSASNDYLRLDKSKEKRYAFDQAFGTEVATQEIFQTTTKPLISAVMQAYNATVFAYGATGAGKTHSMIGTPQDPGVMLLTVGSLLEQAKNSNKVVKCSFIEVYNETLRDLLAADGTDIPLDIREDPSKGICVCGVFETETESLDEVLELLRLGNLRRTTEPTAMNVTSSRSHAVLQVVVEQKDHVSQEVMLGKLSMIDLAGSERASMTNNVGVRLLEGANINKSLLALGNCINALASGCSFVPYRDSKLTRLLKDSLGGSCRTIMMANISPCHLSYEDTLNTLKYANRAKNIRLTARQNIIKPQTHVSQYQQMIEDLRGEVSLLKGKLAVRPKPQVLQHLGEGSPTADPAAAQEAGEHWKEEVVRNLESRTQLQRSLIEVDRGLAQWYVEKDRACSTIARWDDKGRCGSPMGQNVTTRSSGRWSKITSLEEWHDHLQQIEESLRENLETRKSIEHKLQQNKAAGKELQGELVHRVFNEDLRTFLEQIQRVQVLEVERLELDHLREARRAQLEERDQEIETLREQLRLRNEHLVAQRQLLSDEQQKKFPRRVSLLGSTLSEVSPVQKRGPMQVMHAWAPAPKESEDVNSWDSRPLREREPMKSDRARLASDDEKDKEREAADFVPNMAVDWRNVEVPHASQIRGIARIQPPLGTREKPAPIQTGSPLAIKQAAKGWKQPPELAKGGGVDPGLLQLQMALGLAPSSGSPPAEASVAPKPRTGGSAVYRSAPPPMGPQVVRGSTCPPLRRASPEWRQQQPAVAHRPSVDDAEELGAPPRSRWPPRLAAIGSQGVAPAPRRVPPAVAEEKATTPSKRRGRARSQHSGDRFGKVGRTVVSADRR